MTTTMRSPLFVRGIRWAIGILAVAVVVTASAKDAGAIGYDMVTGPDGLLHCVPGYHACLI